MTHPGEQFYPEGVRWDDPISRGTLPDLLSQAAADYGARPAIEFRDRPISYSELEDNGPRSRGERRSCAPATARIVRLRCFSAIRRIIRSISSAALKAGARVVHLSPLDGEIALSHKLSDSGARVLVTSNLSALLPTALKFLERACSIA